MGEPAALIQRMADRPDEDVFGGMVTLVEQGGLWSNSRYRYRVVLEPRAVGLGPHTRTFSHMRVTEVARILVKEAG
ncbi:MAG: hypothetical protein AAGA56_24165, partial [Myxococcota bacterium]